MKKTWIGMFLIVMCFLLAGCNKTDNSSESVGEIRTLYVEEEVIDNLKDTAKINVIGVPEERTLGTITDSEIINKLLEEIKTSSFTGNTYLADAPTIKLEMYDQNENLLDTIDFWHGSERIDPQKSSSSGYFNVQGEENIIKKLIEEGTNYKFFRIYDYSESDDYCSEHKIIYEDANYVYYLNHDDMHDESVFVNFLITDEEIPLKEALNNNYITVEQLMAEYPDLLKMEEK